MKCPDSHPWTFNRGLHCSKTYGVKNGGLFDALTFDSAFKDLEETGDYIQCPNTKRRCSQRKDR